MSALQIVRSHRVAHRAVRGFTLVEILIVVIILGILAAIVIPQFTNASNDARKGNVLSQLQTLRAQIQLYKLQHKDQVPQLVSCPAGQWTPFTMYTDINGATSPTHVNGDQYVYGPYYQHPPVNPLAAVSSGGDIVEGSAASGAGWIYDSATGNICAAGTAPNKYLNESDGTDSDNPTW